VTGGSYRNLIAQLGIDQAFVTLDLPELLGRGQGGLRWDVGVFSNRYGAAGQYDAGKYDTYLFGATHVAGETVSLFYDVGPVTLLLDHGVGAKLDVAPQVAGLPDAPYLPYPGDVQQGTTLLHHAHAGVAWGDVTLGLHYLTSWTDDAQVAGEEDGRITNVGADLKMIGSRFGDAYVGYSRIVAEDPLRLAGAFEAIHSFEGWNLRDNYFGPDATEGGMIDSVLFQYTFSLARYLWHPQEFWGQAQDLTFALFGMYNKVSSDDPAFTGAEQKLKLGGEIAWRARPWITVAGRWDTVQPDLDDNTQSFHVLSPKIVLHTEFASHEEIVIQYSRYVVGDSVTAGWPYETSEPDTDVVKIQAAMWW
jgi:hypothetical protein